MTKARNEVTGSVYPPVRESSSGTIRQLKECVTISTRESSWRTAMKGHLGIWPMSFHISINSVTL